MIGAKKKKLKGKGKGNMPNKADELTYEDEELLWEKGCLGQQEPASLLKNVWYFTTKCFMGSQEARQLKWEDFEKVENDGELLYIEWKDHATKT